MQPDTIELITSEGHKVYIKQNLTRKEVKTVLQIANSAIVFDVTTQRVINPTIADLQQATRKVLEYLIVKIMLPDGTEAKDISAVLDELTYEDEMVLLRKADEITKNLTLSKKNEMS
ncbi:MAG TPA: hypothetical protein VH186_06230 [Chloroflexia bacterium]|nr:hypothetical protein [Chloroflexia bacterium]